MSRMFAAIIGISFWIFVGIVSMHYLGSEEVSGVSNTSTIVLTENNTVNLNMPIYGATAKNVEIGLMAKNLKLKGNEPLYIFLNSPGGQINLGLEIVETAKGLGRPVHTISNFSASMSFMISQLLGTRYVLETATLMSHRAKGEAEGQIPGELTSRVIFFLQQVTGLNNQVAKRAKMSLDEYQRLIANELWMTGEQAVEMKFADKVVKVRCDKTLLGAENPVELSSIFGKIYVTFSKCPLISEPLAIDFGSSEEGVKEFADLLFYDKKTFVNKYNLKEVLR